MKPGVFVAMPIYRGTEFVAETLRSIRAQSFEDYHLMMSVDGEDDPTIEICRGFTSDPRFELVVQPSRLGWPGNLNWLITRCDREFFCYWQQDDIASTNYLEALVKEMAVRLDAAIAYTDVQWFGAAFHRDGTPGIEGDPLSRVMQHIEAIRYEPLRGLMRTRMLPRESDPIPVTPDESHQEEFVFLARMASTGAFIRSSEAMYFKRLHANNAFVRWRELPAWRRRRGWISMGVGMHRVARELAADSDRPWILAAILDRLTIDRPGRGFFYEVPQTPTEIRRFVHDFVAEAGLPADGLQLARLRPEPLARPVHHDVVDGLRIELEQAMAREDVSRQLAASGSFTATSLDQFGHLIGSGWSNPEAWGIWTDGETATLRVPAPPTSAWEAILHLRVHAPHGPIEVGVGGGMRPQRYVMAAENEPLILEVPGEAGNENLVTLHIPDAGVRVPDDPLQDQRALGVGLTYVDIRLL